MPRHLGSRNADYARSRERLAKLVATVVSREGAVDLSFRDMAKCARVSVATLRHYFDDRSGVLAAVFEHWQTSGAAHLALAAIPVRGDIAHSLSSFLQRFREAWVVHQVGKIQSSALAVALAHSAIQELYLNCLLEPLLQAAENLLQRHVDLGELQPCNVREAALHLLSAPFLALLHQESLQGRQSRPLSLDAFFVSHVDSFLRAYPAAKSADVLNQPVERIKKRTATRERSR
jgi:AcrR family transcriptional regulator